MTTPKTQAIVSACDAGDTPDAIAATLKVSLRYVHKVLAEHRPDRARKPSGRRSKLRMLILLRRMEGAKPADVARELAERCSRAYVYRTMGEAI